MPKKTHLPRPILYTLAILLTLATAVFTIVWMVYIQWESVVEPSGLVVQYPVIEPVITVAGVQQGSIAAGAGFQKGDRITHINGNPSTSGDPYFDAVRRGQPGDRVQFTVLRAGNSSPTEVTLTLQSGKSKFEGLSAAQWVAVYLVNCYPLLFFIVGTIVLFQRIEDRNAWLVALLFGAFISGPGEQRIVASVAPSLRTFCSFYAVLIGDLGPAFFYFLFSRFPMVTPLERRTPWLRRFVMAWGLFMAVPSAVSTLLFHSRYPFYVKLGWAPPGVYWTLFNLYLIGVTGLGLVSLIWNAWSSSEREVKRKTRVIMWGAVAATGPLILREALLRFSNFRFLNDFWVEVPVVLAMMILPLTLSYAVLKHRVMEFPSLLKQTVRYALVKGAFVVGLVLLSLYVPWRLASGAAFMLGVDEQASVPFAMALGVASGIVWAVSAGQIEKRIAPRIDRQFFRSVYDTRQILEQLVRKTRTASTRQELAQLLQTEFGEALHPSKMAIYFLGEGKQFELAAASPPILPVELHSIQGGLSILADLAREAKPWDLPPGDRYVEVSLGPLIVLEPDCLVPLMSRDSSLLGVIVLGMKQSEEPYSGEDLQLLESVAGQAAAALENLQMAEDIAARITSQKKTAHELSIAREVQAKLFPQKMPALATLDYVGSCTQARTVGGDYYDFLDLGPGRAGLVLADISGKGIFAALLMANLQANLRSQSAVRRENLAVMLQLVNKFFFESVTPGLYATMFFAEYTDDGRRLRYVNCGHNPPLLTRRDGSCEKLGATATVVGLMEEWEATVEERTLAPGDVLVIYSDGVTEASSDEGVMFGDARLLEAVQQFIHLPVSQMIGEIAAAVHKFSGKEQEDDLTLLIARAR